ncbi:MAG TPA: helix-turn-helix transcriptional regulator [Allosphingosinicella sp.]
MIAGIKQLIARCMERMHQGACATCDNRAYCPAGRWQAAFKPPQEGSSFFGFLAGIAAAADLGSARTTNSLRAQVEKVAEALLPKGAASVDRVAQELGLSRQTLYRRLKAEGVTFEELLQSTRKRLALRYLKRDKLSVKAAAYKLGFSDPAAFSRAFKRWTGSNPGGFRGVPS